MMASRRTRWRLRSWSTAAALLVAATLIMLGWSLASAWTRPPLTPDSWSYLMLARSFHGTAYHIPVIRQYQYHSDFGDSFPPVWPLLLLVASFVLRDDPWLGIIVAAALSIALLPLLDVLLVPFIRARGRRRLAAATCWASLVSTGPFLDEVLSGRSIPAALLLYAALAVAVIRPARLSFRAGLLAGLAGGLLWMTRFDAAPVVLIVGILVPLAWRHGPRLQWWFAYGLAAAVVLTPWAIFSRRAFGVSWATAPAMMARNVAPSLVVDWYPSPPSTIADAPLAWASRVAGNVPALFAALWRMAARYAFATSLLVLFAGWACMQAGNFPARPARASRLALLLVIGLCGQLAGPVLIGGFDLRYFSPLLAAVTLVSVSLILNARTKRFRSMMLAPLAIGLVLGWRKAFGAQRAQRPVFAAVVAPDRVDRWPAVAGVPLGLLERCVPVDARLLVVEKSDAPYLIGYYLGRTTLEVPDNWAQLSERDHGRFLTEFSVSQVLGSAGPLPVPADHVRAIAGCASLYAVPTPPN